MTETAFRVVVTMPAYFGETLPYTTADKIRRALSDSGFDVTVSPMADALSAPNSVTYMTKKDIPDMQGWQRITFGTKPASAPMDDALIEAAEAMLNACLPKPVGGDDGCFGIAEGRPTADQLNALTSAIANARGDTK